MNIMSQNTLSLLAKYDDMCRLNNSLISTDQAFKDVLIKSEYNRSRWLQCKQELQKSEVKNTELEVANADLKQKLSRLRFAYGEEIRKFEEKNKECLNLRRIVDTIKEHLRDDDCNNRNIRSSKSGSSNSIDCLLSTLSTDQLLKRMSNNSRTFRPNRMNDNNNISVIDEEELNFDKTEDSINVSKINNYGHSFVVPERISESRQTYLVNKNGHDSPTSSSRTQKTYEIRSSTDCVKSDTHSPTSTFSEDYCVPEDCANRIVSNQDIQYIDDDGLMTNDDSTSIHRTELAKSPDQYRTPKSMVVSSPTILQSTNRYLKSCDSIKSVRKVRLELDRLDKRKHTVQLKKVFKPLVCVPCGKSITFCSKCVVCVDCRSVAHVHCEKDLGLPCIPHYTPKGVSRSGVHTHMLMIGDFVSPDTRPFVPSLLVHCCNEIDRRALSEQGIYRKCGSGREIRELKQKFLHSKTGPPNISKVDPHVLCGVVKLFLRDLDDPLITRILWHDFARATDVINTDRTEELLKMAIEQLPDANRDSLAFLILHLQRVATETESNRMTIKSIAKIFGPTAVGYSIANPPITSIVAENGKQVQIMESLLEISSSFWEDKLRNPGIIADTPVRGLNTPNYRADRTLASEVNSPTSYRSALSNLYATPRARPSTTRYTPAKRNRLFTPDLIY